MALRSPRLSCPGNAHLLSVPADLRLLGVRGPPARRPFLLRPSVRASPVLGRVSAPHSVPPLVCTHLRFLSVHRLTDTWAVPTFWPSWTTMLRRVWEAMTPEAGPTPRLRGVPTADAMTPAPPDIALYEASPSPEFGSSLGRKAPPRASGRGCGRADGRRGRHAVGGAGTVRAPNTDSRLTHLRAPSLSLLSFSPSFTLSSSLCKSIFAWSSCFTSRLNTQNQRRFSSR